MLGQVTRALREASPQYKEEFSNKILLCPK